MSNKANQPNEAAPQRPEADEKKLPDLTKSDPRVRKVSITKWSKSKREDY